MAVSQRERERKRVSARQRAETHKTGYERTSLNIGADVPVFKLDRATTRRIDVIPYRVTGGNPCVEAGELSPERTYWTHRGIGANNDTFVCPAKTAKKPCPICEYRSKLQRDPDAAEDLIKDLAPKERQLWNVIDAEEPEKGVQLWDVSFHLFGKLLDAEIRNADEGDEYEFYADPMEGMTLKLGVAEKSFAGNTFYEVETIGFKRRREQYDEDVIDKAHPLDKLLIIPDYDKLKAVFLQTDAGSEDDEDEQKPPKKGSTKAAKAKDDDDKPPRDRKALVKGLEEGQMVRHRQFGECEIVRISSDGTSLTLEDSDGDIHKAVEPSEVRPLATEEPAKAKPKETVKPPADDDWDDKDEPKAAKPKGKSKPPAEEEDDWDDEPAPKAKDKAKDKGKKAEEEDDDWDDEPAPKKKAKKEVEEDEDEPAPKKSKGKAKADEDDWD